MHPADCPAWEYEDLRADARQVILPRAQQILQELDNGTLNARAEVGDSRAAHSRLFDGLTPPACDYFAGHYRGEEFRCLRWYGVHIPADPRVGTTPDRVAQELAVLVADAQSAIDALDQFVSQQSDEALRLQSILSIACEIFVEFLRIHPYANGNGHVARMLICGLFCRYGYRPQRWAIEPKPLEPFYSAAIGFYRDGFPDLFHHFVLRRVLGQGP